MWTNEQRAACGGGASVHALGCARSSRTASVGEAHRHDRGGATGCGRWKGPRVWDAVSIEAIQSWTARAGWMAAPLYVLAFVVSSSLAVPGILFVLGGLVAFGAELGIPVVLVGAASAGTFATWWMSRIGGESTGPPASPIARRIQARLEDRPIMAVAMLRFFTRLGPPAHMLLALAGVSPWQNFVGTLVGFAPRVIVAAVFLEPVLDWYLER